ncbi:MAG: dienelactone hydrolase family protein [Acidimicrobiales bacterium]
MAQAQWLTLDTADGPMQAYEVVPDGAPKGAVIVIQEAFGVNEHIQDVARRTADAGYHAIAPAIFHRAGGGVAEYGDFKGIMALIQGLSDDGLLMDVDAALAHLQTKGFAPGQVGIVGFCMGGRITFLVAARRAIGAGVGYYGGGIVSEGRLPFPALIGDVATMKTPWLGIFGDKDASIPVEDVERLRAELDAKAPVDHGVIRYPDADHGFNCNDRASYHEASAADAWPKTLEFFAKHLR